LSNLRAEICTIHSSAHWIGRDNRKKLHQAKLIFPFASPKLDRIHALAHEVQSEAAGFYIVEIAAPQFLFVDRGALVFHQNLQGRLSQAGVLTFNPAKKDLDGLFSPAVIGMANNVCKRFIDSPNDRTAILGGKTEILDKIPECAADSAKRFRVATHFEFQQ
jgi:hypothetical protein